MHSDSIISRWKSLTSGERSRLRKLQLEKVEREQLLEEKKALIMTEEERDTLLMSFQSVKTEFLDLDGLSWSESPPHDELIGSYHQGSGHIPSHARAPSEITNSPVIGQRHLLRRSPTDIKVRSNRSKPEVRITAETIAHSSSKMDPNSMSHQVTKTWSIELRPENGALGPDGNAAPTTPTCMSRDDTLRASYYIPLATSPKATLSPLHVDYVAGTSLPCCSLQVSGSPVITSGIRVPSTMGVQQPQAASLPSRRDLDLPFGSVSYTEDMTPPGTTGLRLSEPRDAVLSSKKPYPELPMPFDVAVTPCISDEICGLPRSPHTRWPSSPSSQSAKSFVSAPVDEQEVASYTTLGLALSFPQAPMLQAADTAAIPQSPASRWLALYYDPRLRSSQALSVDLLPTAPANGNPSGSERHRDSDLDHFSQGQETPSPTDYGPFSLKPGLSARQLSPSNIVRSGCPHPLLLQTCHAPNAQEHSMVVPPLQSLQEIRQSTSSYILESYSIAAHLHV